MTLPLITRTLLKSGQGESAIGRVYAWNTLGSIIGVAVGGMVLLPIIGLKPMLIAGATADMLIGVLLVYKASDRRVGLGRLALPSRRLAAVLGIATFVVGGVVARGIPLEQRLLTSGVYRHGDRQSTAQWDMLFYRDGRTILARVGTTDHSDVPLGSVPSNFLRT